MKYYMAAFASSLVVQNTRPCEGSAIHSPLSNPLHACRELRAGHRAHGRGNLLAEWSHVGQRSGITRFSSRHSLDLLLIFWATEREEVGRPRGYVQVVTERPRSPCLLVTHREVVPVSLRADKPDK